jgi:hypothetical protein
MADLRSLHGNKRAEILMQAVRDRFSQKPELNVIFISFLVTPARKRYCGTIQRPSLFAASMETMRQQRVDTLVKVFSYDATEIIRLFQDYSHNLRQFDSMKDLYLNYRTFISGTGQQLDIRSFTHFAKRVKSFPRNRMSM